MKCKECTQRHATCHVSCEDYQNWCTERAERKAAANVERQAELYAIEKWENRKRQQALLKKQDRATGRKRFKE